MTLAFSSQNMFRGCGRVGSGRVESSRVEPSRVYILFPVRLGNVFCNDGNPSGGQDKSVHVICIHFCHEVSYDHNYGSH